MSRASLSVVTPSLNSADFIEETIRSVLSQSVDIEYIVVDSGSTDGTVEILDKYQERVRRISAPELSQSAAINKGFRESSGDLVAWLNADDVYMPDTARTVLDFFEANPNAHFLFGDAMAVDRSGKDYGRRAHVGPADKRGLVFEADYIVQPAAFWTRSLLQQIGPLREDLDYAMDYEYWMRAARHFELHYLPRPLAKERLHGGAKTVVGGVRRLEEIRAIAEEHGGSGVPRSFRPEAAAVYLIAAFQALFRLKGSPAKQHFAAAFANLTRPFKTLGFLAAILLSGPRGLAKARLFANRWRARSRSRV